MDVSQASGLGSLYPGYVAEDDYQPTGEILGPRVRVEMVSTTVGEDVHEEGTLKDLGDSSRLLKGAAALQERGVRVFLTDTRHFTAMNEVYEGFVSEPYPARTTVYVGLPEGLKVEIDEIAVVEKNSGRT